MPASDIVVKGAREHNLQDVNLVLPRNQLICLTGVSGSGKSSFAFDTVFAEGQRRYVESLSSFARQFLGQMPKPDVDLISGLSPSISISQKSSGNNPRSTVGTITEIYDFLRVLYARVGQGYCPSCDKPITAQSRDQIIGAIMMMEEGTDYAVLAPVVRNQKGEHRDLFSDLLKRGYTRARVDGEIVLLSSDVNLDRTKRHNVEVVVDRLTAGPSIRGRLSESVEAALKLGKGTLVHKSTEKRLPTPKPLMRQQTIGLNLMQSKVRNPNGQRNPRAPRRRLLLVVRQIASFPRSTLAPDAESVSRLRRRKCSASIAPKACVRPATDWASCSLLIVTC